MQGGGYVGDMCRQGHEREECRGTGLLVVSCPLLHPRTLHPVHSLCRAAVVLSPTPISCGAHRDPETCQGPSSSLPGLEGAGVLHMQIGARHGYLHM